MAVKETVAGHISRFYLQRSYQALLFPNCHKALLRRHREQIVYWSCCSAWLEETASGVVHTTCSHSTCAVETRSDQTLGWVWTSNAPGLGLPVHVFHSSSHLAPARCCRRMSLMELILGNEVLPEYLIMVQGRGGVRRRRAVDDEDADERARERGQGGGGHQVLRAGPAPGRLGHRHVCPPRSVCSHGCAACPLLQLLR